MSIDRIHILGASGSGTTTLGRVVSERFGYTHLDTDYFYWHQTDPPYQMRRDECARSSLLARSLSESPRWVLSGSLCGWGDLFIPQFDLVIFLWVPSEARVARLRRREAEELGDLILPGGFMHQHFNEFIEWAAQYDEGLKGGRNRKLHENWMKNLTCPLIRLEGEMTTEQQLEILAPHIA